jgi:hypothetical protein
MVRRNVSSTFVAEDLGFGALWICRSMPTFRLNVIDLQIHTAPKPKTNNNMIIIIVRISSPSIARALAVLSFVSWRELHAEER